LADELVPEKQVAEVYYRTNLLFFQVLTKLVAGYKHVSKVRMSRLVLVLCRKSQLERDHERDKVHDKLELAIEDGQDILVPTTCPEAFPPSLAHRKYYYLMWFCVHVIYHAEVNVHQFCVVLLE
jgi:hypothetical protein